MDKGAERTSSNRILVVDDDPSIVALLEAILTGAGYEVQTAGTGRDTLARLDESTFAVALVDLKLPDIGGLELVDLIRKKQHDLWIIIITGFPSTRSALDAIQRGVYGYLIKPFVRGHLLQMVNSAFEARELACENLRLAVAEAESRRLAHELTLAGQVQKAMMPSDKSFPRVDVVTCLQPVDALAGDFYNYVRVDDNRLMMYIGDVVGQGSVAAITMLVVHMTMAQHCMRCPSPGRILAATNLDLWQIVREDIKESILTTAFCGALDLTDCTFRYSRAAHDGVLWWNSRTHECTQLDADGFHLGLFNNSEYEEKVVQLQEGDLLLFYTDGIIDATNASGQRFGRSRLLDIVSSHAAKDAAEVRDQIIRSVSDFVDGRPPSDDRACMVLKLSTLKDN